VILQENDNGGVEVAAVNPLTSMAAVENDVVQEVAGEIKKRLEKVIQSL
jgi:hypothetical protein